jgi:hypothetical protein
VVKSVVHATISKGQTQVVGFIKKSLRIKNVTSARTKGDISKSNDNEIIS